MSRLASLPRARTALLCAALVVLPYPVAAGAAPPAPLRNVMAVGNGQGGTVSFIDTATLHNLGSIDAVPDLQERLDSMTVTERIGYELVNQIQGYRKLVDDMAVSPDGTTLYVSRGALSDAVAFDIASRRMLWRYKVDGIKADHAALSPDGSRFIVSATTSGKAEVLDTATGRAVTSFATGTYPHANDYSPDGTVLYNSSIGLTSLPKSLNLLKGIKSVTAVDPVTFRTRRIYLFDYGVRPAVFTADNHTMYAQLSYLNGFVEYNLTTGRTTRTVQLPYSAKAAAMNPDDYPQNSAQHGMAINGGETKLCVAGTIDDYVSIVSRPALTTDGTVHYDPDSLPYWAETSTDGNRCFVSLAEKDEISVVDYASATEVTRIPVGHFPQRERLARLSAPAIAALTPGG
jgi:DNA-binding beta-propeller fold protein YncE